jgi:hypothetical protein
MSSQYHPQLFGWIYCLDKGAAIVPRHDRRLLYANDNDCAFLHKTLAS